MPIYANFARPRKGAIDFSAINQAALGYLPSLVRQWCPDGKRCGREYVALNPTRPDMRPGSFSINLETGRWADFSTGDRGGDVISLAAYIFRCRQVEAARVLATTIGLDDVAP
jgi:hypothetical protein